MCSGSPAIRLWTRIALQKNTLGFQSFIFFGNNFREIWRLKNPTKVIFLQRKTPKSKGGLNVLGGGRHMFGNLSFDPWNRAPFVFFNMKIMEINEFHAKNANEPRFHISQLNLPTSWRCRIVFKISQVLVEHLIHLDSFLRLIDGAPWPGCHLSLVLWFNFVCHSSNCLKKSF